MTIGTGYFGKSSVGENLQPKHLINRTLIAYNSNKSMLMPDFTYLNSWSAPQGSVPAYPIASNLEGAPFIPQPSAPIEFSEPMTSARRSEDLLSKNSDRSLRVDRG